MKVLRSSLVVGAAGTLIAVLTLATGACSSTTSGETAVGGSCFTASDCRPGLVCVPQRDGARICTSDLTGATGNPPPEAGSEAGDAEPFDGNAPADGATPEDTGTPDTGTDSGIVDASDAG